MFNKNTKLVAQIEGLEKQLVENDRLNRVLVERMVEQENYKISQLVNKHQDELARIVSNHDTVLEKHSSVLKKQVSELDIETQTQAKEIEMYTKAFENLGFDVKDMKDILNKLVDGLIAKNEIKLVK
jgi:uncharacterized protein (UPF0335 family)